MIEQVRLAGVPRRRSRRCSTTPSTQAREVLRAIPDGDYRFADYADEDGVDGQSVPPRS